ncbi:MAG: hypothetical protein JXR40_00820 [Pontiellaceae bacterium]|nr:hypothetical protein [Pontiellaceae bacterium]
MEELDPIKLKAELDQFKREKEKIRQLMGQIGGKHQNKRDQWINGVFVTSIILLAANDILQHFWHIHVPIDTQFSLVVAIFLVSIKIIWMMHKATKVEHFQFWILNSIEFRLNDVAKQLRNLEKTLDQYHAEQELEKPIIPFLNERAGAAPAKNFPS